MKYRKNKNDQEYVGFAAMKRAAMRDKKFRAAHDALRPKYDLIRAVLNARIKKGISQSELARRVGTTQSAIARFESGAGNPTLDFLSRVSSAVGARLEVRTLR